MASLKIKSNISDISPYTVNKEKYPMFIARVQAGFPSPGDDYIEKNLDLNELLIKNPSATFFVKVEGDSMVNAGINSGDTLVVDKAIEAKDKSIVIAHIIDFSCQSPKTFFIAWTISPNVAYSKTASIIGYNKLSLFLEAFSTSLSFSATN